MAEITNFVNELLSTRRNETISVANSKVCKQFLQLLVKEEHVKVQTITYNCFKIKDLSINRIVTVDRRPVKAKKHSRMCIQGPTDYLRNSDCVN